MRGKQDVSTLRNLLHIFKQFPRSWRVNFLTGWVVVSDTYVCFQPLPGMMCFPTGATPLEA